MGLGFVNRSGPLIEKSLAESFLPFWSFANLWFLDCGGRAPLLFSSLTLRSLSRVAVLPLFVSVGIFSRPPASCSLSWQSLLGFWLLLIMASTGSSLLPDSFFSSKSFPSMSASLSVLTTSSSPIQTNLNLHRVYYLNDQLHLSILIDKI